MCRPASAVKELSLRYYLGETLIITIYIYICVPGLFPANICSDLIYEVMQGMEDEWLFQTHTRNSKANGHAVP